MKTDECDQSFVSVSRKVSHHQTYTKFLQHTKPQNYVFVSYKYTSPYTMTNLHTVDHGRITGYLRTYDPIKQYFCLLPFNNTSRPLIVPQKDIIQFDDFLLPCNIPTQIVKPLTVNKHLVSSPLDDKFYYTALSKQSYSYNELLFISEKLFLIWYKLNKRLNINHLLLNIPHLIETLLKIFIRTTQSYSSRNKSSCGTIKTKFL